jgi:hypothetical protein
MGGPEIHNCTSEKERAGRLTLNHAGVEFRSPLEIGTQCSYQASPSTGGTARPDCRFSSVGRARHS